MLKSFILNEKYNKFAEEDEDVHRNINWKLKKRLEHQLWRGNAIDFEELQGTVGFGKTILERVLSLIHCCLHF